MPRLILVALLSVFVLPSSASAMSLKSFRAVLAASQPIAEARWAPLGHPDACTGRVTYEAVKYQALADARASERQADQGDAFGVLADANPTTCVIRIAWDAMLSPSTTCMTMEHERGHLHGLRFPDNPADPLHSLNPRSIMALHVFVAPPECRRAFPPYRVRYLRPRGWHCSPGINGTEPVWACQLQGHKSIVDIPST